METPNDPQQFKPDYKWLLEGLSEIKPTELKILFDKATTELCEKSWVELYKHEHVGLKLTPVNLTFPVKESPLPFPYPQPQKSYSQGFTQEEAQWLSDERKWSTWADTWLKEKIGNSNYKISQAEQYLEHRIKAYNDSISGLGLVSSVLKDEWLNSIYELSLSDFLRLQILDPKKSVAECRCGIIDNFLAKKVNERREHLMPGLSEEISSEPDVCMTNKLALIQTHPSQKGINKKNVGNEVKRVTYKNTQKEQTVKYYESEVRDAITKAVRREQAPNQKKIDAAIRKHIVEVRGIPERTLRNYLRDLKRGDLFGKIFRQVLEIKALYIK